MTERSFFAVVDRDKLLWSDGPTGSAAVVDLSDVTPILVAPAIEMAVTALANTGADVLTPAPETPTRWPGLEHDLHERYGIRAQVTITAVPTKSTYHL